MSNEAPPAWVDLYWLPLGAGGHFVRWNGRAYERWVAYREQRRSRAPTGGRAPGWRAGLELARRQVGEPGS